MGFFDVLGTAASTLEPFINAGSSLLNMYREDYWNKRQESMTRETWNREDNAVQRRVADLKAAGLNPALAAGSAAASSGGANFTTSNQAQFSFDSWIKNPLNREAYKQEKWNTQAAKYNALGIMNQAYDLAEQNYWNNGYSMMFNSKGKPFNNNNVLLDSINSMRKNQINTATLQSLYNYNQQNYFNSHQDFTNALNLLNSGISPILDVLDVAGSLRRNFGTYKGDFTYRRR